MRTSIRPIGNSLGVIIPRPMLTQVGLSYEVEMTVESGAIVLRPPAEPTRAGWAEAARRIAVAGDDSQVMSDVGNAADEDIDW
jgi:antitoxin MazE